MPSPEAFYHPRPLEAQPTTSLRMEQVVTQLAATHNVDLSQKGATLNLDVADKSQQWMIGNVDGQRFGVTRCLVDKENGLIADLDMVFEVKPEGWEPVEVIHTAASWQEYAKNIATDAQGNFDFAALADTVAEDIEQKATATERTTGVVFDMNQTNGEEEMAMNAVMVSVAEAAERLGMTPQGVNRIIKLGKVKAETRHITEVVERQRAIAFVSLTELQQYRETNGKSGRPKKG